MCNVEQIADCGDISSIGRALFINEKDDSLWLSQCIASLSPCGNLLAIGYKKRLCFLTTQWISSNDSSTYLITWSGTLPLDITSVLTLSICPSKHSSQNGPDWFCIVVGFLNGSVGFYTNTGHLLLQEKLDEKPVCKISCHTGTYGTLLDDIHIFFPESICIVSGASLFQILRNAKAQLAKVHAGVQEDYTIDSRNIAIRKWTLTDQEEISDIAIAGLELINTYDHYLGASTYNGYDTWYRSIPPVKTLVLAAGAGPFMGFHYAVEGGTNPPLQDVARAVANKIKSALPGWLGGSTEVGPANTEPLIRAEQLAMRSSIYDPLRQGTSIAISPDRRLAAFTDNLGRVAILDLAKGYIIRMFKGCRDAQCAFVQIFDAENKKPQVCVAKEIRRAIFLIIYMPKKGLVDIRLMQRGTRVAVFTATKNGRLLYNTCGLVGAEKNYTHKKLNLPEIQCVLFDPDGKLKKFNIPFYYALEGEHLERSRDLHVIREIRDIVKKASGSLDENQSEIMENVAKIKTLEIKKHCLETLIKNCASVDIIISCLRIFWEDLINAEIVSHNEKIKNYFGNLTIITHFYLLINNETTDDMEDLLEKVYEMFDIKNEPSPEIEITNDKNLNFQLLEDDTCIIERLLILAQETDPKEQEHAKVTFADHQDSSYKDIVNAFVLEEHNRYIYIKNELSVDKQNSLSRKVFASLIRLKDYSLITNYLKICHIDPQEILELIITHLVNTPLQEINIQLIEKFLAIIYYTCKASEEASYIVYNEISPWWDNIRQLIIDLKCPLRSMIVAMACKAVVKIIESLENSSESDGAWESVTTENAKWGILIGKLEDISILSIILLNKATFQGEVKQKLQVDEININLKYIYTRGQGSVTELIAKWLCSMGIPPAAVIVNELMEIFDPDAGSENDDRYEYTYVFNHRFHVENNPQIFKWLSLLRRQFPLSTKADYIIANMCWEYAMEWQKNMIKSELLATVAEHLYSISDLHLKLGLFSIIWSTYLKQVFESCCKFINKVGKLPKDPLCLQDLGFNSECLVETLKLINNYLEKFTVCCVCLRHSVEHKKQTVKYEKIWDESLPSLVEVAQDTKNVNKDILSLNFQLSCIVYYQCHFSVKFPKALDTLFDVDYEYILEAFSDTPVDKEINMNCSEKIKNPRRKFLTKLVRKAIDIISPNKSLAKYDEWIENFCRLSELWNLECKFVQQQNIIGLYHLGHDRLVLERMGPHLDPAYLIEPLVAIGVQRMKRSLSESTNHLEWIATISAPLYYRLRNTEMDTSIPSNPSMETTALILRKLLREVDKLPEGTCDPHDVKLATHLAENCEFIARRKL